MTTKKRKILVHVCCAACASYTFAELEKENFEIIAYFYNPQTHGLAEYKRRLKDLQKLCQEKGIEIITPEYNIQDFFSMVLPYQDKNSIKYISDKKRFRRKRCQMCVNLLIMKTGMEAKRKRNKYFTSSMLCSPYKDHNEIWDCGMEVANFNKLTFFYKDFRKGYWTGRNYARTHKINIPTYCGCTDSIEEGRLE